MILKDLLPERWLRQGLGDGALFRRLAKEIHEPCGLVRKWAFSPEGLKLGDFLRISQKLAVEVTVGGRVQTMDLAADEAARGVKAEPPMSEEARRELLERRRLARTDPDKPTLIDWSKT